jgi:hypothetical protein
MSVHETSDPALRTDGPKPTDFDLPAEERTRAAPYLFAIALLLGVAILIVVGSVIKFAETSESISNSSDAFAPTENLAPPVGSDSEGAAVVDDDVSAAPRDAGTSASPAVPGEADQ